MTYIEHDATINWDDGQIRFWPAYRLDDDEYKATRAVGLNWSRGEKCFKGPWSPQKEDFLASQFGIEELADDETSLLERAESRAEFYQGWSDNAATRANQAHKTADQIAERFAFGQPILIGHHSEKKARKDKDRIATNMNKAIHEKKRSDYWQNRAKRAVAAAERRYRPDVIHRRIEKLEADLRDAIRHDSPRRIDFYQRRLEYQRALYEVSGGMASDGMTFEIGGAVLCWAGLCEIKRVNKKSITVVREIRENVTWDERIPYDKVKRVFSKDDYRKAKNKS